MHIINTWEHFPSVNGPRAKAMNDVLQKMNEWVWKEGVELRQDALEKPISYTLTAWSCVSENRQGLGQERAGAKLEEINRRIHTRADAALPAISPHESSLSTLRLGFFKQALPA